MSCTRPNDCAHIEPPVPVTTTEVAKTILNSADLTLKTAIERKEDKKRKRAEEIILVIILVL